MNQTSISLTIIGMLVVTYLPRVMPIWFLSTKTLSPRVAGWLGYVPVAVLAAMLLPSLVVQEGQITIGIQNLFFWAALPTLAVAWKTRSFFGAVITGMGLVALTRYVLQ